MIRKFVAWTGLYYLTRSPIRRGKVRLAKLLDPLTRGVPMKSPLGPLLSARLTDATFWLCMNDYQSFVAATVEGLEPGDVFIDIGANIGIFSLAAAQRVGPTGLVLSFEPSLREFNELVRNLHLNNASNVVPFRIALDSSDSIGELFVSGETQAGLNSRARQGDEVEISGVEQVMVLKFDSLGVAELIGKDRRVFIKIDTEGCELRVLEGMQTFLTSHRVEKIVAELNDILLDRLGGTKKQLYDFLAALGFVGTAGNNVLHYDEVFVRSPSQASPANTR